MKFIKNKYLFFELIKIEFTQIYKRSFIGVAWIIFLPLVQSIIWIFLQKSGLLNPGKLDINYTAYILVGTLLWQLYAQSYDLLGNSISSSIRLHTQGFVPVLTVITAKFVLILVRFLISGFINMTIIILFLDVSLNIGAFLISIIPLAILCFSIGIFVSMIEVVSEDIYILGKEFNKVLLFLTPIIYSPKFDAPIVHTIIKFNPLTYLIGVPRDILLTGTSTVSLSTFSTMTVIVTILFAINLFVYNKRVRILIEKLIE